MNQQVIQRIEETPTQRQEIYKYSAHADGGPHSRVCARKTLRLSGNCHLYGGAHRATQYVI